MEREHLNHLRSLFGREPVTLRSDYVRLPDLGDPPDACPWCKERPLKWLRTREPERALDLERDWFRVLRCGECAQAVHRERDVAKAVSLASPRGLRV